MRLQCHPCEKQEEVLNALDQHKIDLILLQIVMKSVSGYEILKNLKKNAAYSRIPIIVISPLKEYDAAVRCYELGADDYLTKPFSSVIFKAKINNYMEKKKLLDREQIYLANLKQEKEKSEKLLLNILPAANVERLKTGEQFIADRVETSVILFADLVNFTGLAEKIRARELIDMLNKVFSMIDLLVEEYHIEKIKTIGDSYMAAAGVPVALENPAEAMAEVALKILDSLDQLNKAHGYSLQMRIGIHSGPIIAGIIGTKKLAYDLWGKTVNFASRMESHGVPGKIQVSENTYELLKDKYTFEEPRIIHVKGLGNIPTYILVGRRS